MPLHKQAFIKRMHDEREAGWIVCRIWCNELALTDLLSAMRMLFHQAGAYDPKEQGLPVAVVETRLAVHKDLERVQHRYP